jgi:hypothetical protein
MMHPIGNKSLINNKIMMGSQFIKGREAGPKN